MFFHAAVLFYSLIFWLALEIAARPGVAEVIDTMVNERWFWLAVLLLTIMIYSFFIAHRIGKRIAMTPILLVLTPSALVLGYLMDSPLEHHVFITLSVVIYYAALLGIYRLRLYNKDQTARGLISAAAAATVFLFYAATYGIYINFALPLWLLMLAYIAVTYMVTYQFLLLTGKDSATVTRYCLILSLVMAEIAWIINFWPFGYLTTGVITLIFYYVFWDIIQAHFLDVLSKKRVVSSLILLSTLMTLVLLTSRWMTVV